MFKVFLTMKKNWCSESSTPSFWTAFVPKMNMNMNMFGRESRSRHTFPTHTFAILFTLMANVWVGKVCICDRNSRPNMFMFMFIFGTEIYIKFDPHTFKASNNGPQLDPTRSCSIDYNKNVWIEWRTNHHTRNKNRTSIVFLSFENWWLKFHFLLRDHAKFPQVNDFFKFELCIIIKVKLKRYCNSYKNRWYT